MSAIFSTTHTHTLKRTCGEMGGCGLRVCLQYSPSLFGVINIHLASISL